MEMGDNVGDLGTMGTIAQNHDDDVVCAFAGFTVPIFNQYHREVNGRERHGGDDGK